MDSYKKELLEILLVASKDKKMFEAFLTDMLTPAEHKVLAKRWQIVKRLARGDDQRSIANELKIGISTVTRGSRELQDPYGGFKQILKQTKKGK